MSDDQFFDGGWCWMSHPEYNDGNAIPVKMEAAEGGRWFYPLDPRGASEEDWDRRDKQWEMVQPPMADLERAVELDDLRASHQRLKEALETCVAAIERTHHVDAAGRLAAADKAREALRSTP
jgi:hypothetical protein